MLSVRNIHVYYGSSHILQGVSLDVKENEVVSILGRNGAGKTTTMKAIMGLVPVKSGEIVFEEQTITNLPAFKVARNGIGYVPQGRHIFPSLTVLENLRTGTTDREQSVAFQRVFSIFPVLQGRLSQAGMTLSGGEQQQLCLARALATTPRFILMDEPTEGLMPSLVSKVKEVIRQISEQGIAVLLAEQRVPIALELSDRVIIMEKGVVRYEGAPQELDRKEVLLRYLGVT